MNIAGYLVGLGALVVSAWVYARRLVPIRIRAVRLLESAIPANEGDAIFRDVARDYGGVGTTCGYLASWLLYRLGKREGVNRTTEFGTYKVAHNMAAVRGNPAFVVWRPGLRPSPGDIVFLSDGPPNTEHVAGVIRWDDGPNGILTADYGQRGPNGKQAGRFVLRRWEPETGQVSREDTGLRRKLVGWIDIERAK